MSLKYFATLALATIAAAKPISAPVSKRQSNIFGDGFNGAVLNGFKGDGFNFADGFNNFNEQQQIIQIQQENLQIIDNGRQQQIVQQVNQVLVVDQVNNGFSNDMNNLFRKSNFQNQFRDVTTVMLVVQEIQIAIDDGRGNQIQQEIFAQSVVVANRGARETQTVMVFDSRKLIAQDILGNNAFQNIGQFNGIAGATGAVRNDIPTKTQGVQLFGAKPTWSAVAEDPAAALGGIWEQNIQDLQKNDNDAADIQLNAEIAKQEAQALKDAQQQEQGQDQAKDQEAQKAEEEAKKAEEEQAKKAEEEAKKAQEEQAKAADEQAKKAEEEQKKAADEAKKAQEEQAKAAEQPKRA
ncbi:hypothetical protein HBH56_059520 [Parastagonospora nodorum]|uniref:Uncharacterized protein n=2 Tax=Phaeosphaeria nodorum (strain SN15 / ATCC MYA-4574 / FGSC 10173) TaxID=321614 RepID=A0A7U2HVG3_PHANO|nr:hypothetical protein SNOG_02009 [Parastagonospora nodorum SN15]KAH3916510.1 hypothetical protein HBH56_059520 [Parastagonospora nodorum]EAT90221.1 hypothetical protein SNOG_02009 [Parastagonospora nodorum SN15]KAH3930866.1 hypothetical protein HBH54_103450 [Parastagonospora nodorum]KAH4140866.1 hypothetical protein HBH45_078310 [Parastagonospora nodorum]KAH4167898.1 hypothetical protein HBH44_054170 [Parastagonospora nodorum]